MLAGAAALAVVATLPQDGRDLALANADALLAEGLYHDLFVDRYPLADWRFSTTTFLFPDAPLYFLGRVFVDNAAAALWIFAALLFAATVVAAAYTVAAHCGASQSSAAGQLNALAWTGVGGLAFILANHNGWIGAGGWLPDPFMATWHGGTCLAAFVSVALFQYWLTARRTWIAAGLALTGLLTTASDAAFFSMFTAPALGAWLVCARRADIKTRLFGGALLLIPPLAGRILLHSLNASGAIRIADPASRAADKLGALASLQTIQDLAEVVRQLSPAFWIVSLLSLGLLGALWLAGRRAGRSDQHRLARLDRPATTWLYAWLALSVISQPIFTALAGRLLYDFPWQPRYLLTALYIPFVFGAPLALAPFFKSAPRRWVAGGSAVIVALGATLTLPILSGPRLEPTTPALVNCVDKAAQERSLRYGLAGYFEAKPLTFYSQAGVRVNQLALDFAPFYWLNNFAWYLGNSAAPIEYDFLVWPTDRTADAIAFYGPADDVIACPQGFQLLVYKDPGQTRFRRQFSREGLLLWRRAVGLE